jgi:MYXO-CTERM domain-containing protein
VIGALALGLAGPASAEDYFEVKDGVLLSSDLPIAELPAGMVGSAVFPETGAQDLWVLGLVGTTIQGQAPLPVAVRYGRVNGRGDARIVLGPTELALPSSAVTAATQLRGAVARGGPGSVLAVASGLDSTLYLFDARNGRAATVGALGQIVDLKTSAASIGKVGAMAGLGSKIFAVDSTRPVVAQIDLATGVIAACRVDSQPQALRVASGNMLVLTDKGTAQLAADCASTTAAAQPPRPDPIPGISQSRAPDRSYYVSERTLEITFPPNSAGTRARRGTGVQLIGSSAVTLTINKGTCTNVTTFLAGDILANPVAATALNLSTTTPRLGLYAEQTSPGEDCVAFLSNPDGTELLLRVRGAPEGLGANVLLVDRSWSTERSLLGAGAARNSEDQRINAERQALIALLGGLSVTNATGPWAVMPFTEDAPSSLAMPQSGFGSIPELGNPESPRGLRLKGLSGQMSDVLVPGGPTDLIQSIRTALTRLDSAAMLNPVTTGPQRRLWLLTDGSAGKKGYGDFYRLIPSMLRSQASLHLLGVGGLDGDPLLPQMLALTQNLGGERLFSSGRGVFGINHTVSTLVESTLSQLVRSVLRGRPIGTVARGDVGTGKTLTNTFRLARSASGQLDPWVLFVAAWDQADATMSLGVVSKGSPLVPRCVQGGSVLVCAISGLDGDVNVTLSGMRPGGASAQAVLRTYVSSSGPQGEVLFFPSFGRSLWRSGDRVRVQVQLSERGLPLRLAKVSAKVNGPNNAIGSVVAANKVGSQDIQNLIQMNGDLSPGQALAELTDPINLPGLKPIGQITLADDATGGDYEAQDGIYTAEFPAFVPGAYLVDLHVEYTGLFGNTGTIEDRIIQTVVVGLDAMRTSGGSRSEVLASGLRLRFAPQDAGRNLLGPGQGAALSFFQNGKLLPATVGDYLDGSYRVDLTGADAAKPVELALPGSRIQLYNPANPNPGEGGASTGCSVATGPAQGTLAAPLVLLLCALLLRRRRDLLDGRG